MVAVAGILSKSREPIRDSLIKMLIEISHNSNDVYSICIDGNFQKVKNISELNNASLHGNIGLGIISTYNSSINSLTPQFCELQNIGGNCNCAFYGDIYIPSQSLEQNNITPSEKFDTFSKIFIDNFKKNSIRSSVKKIIEKIDGEFVFIIHYDGKIIIGRDIVGIKTLYIGVNEKYIVCSTEKKALWTLGMIENIRAVFPGECVIVTPQRIMSYKIEDRFKNYIENITFKKCVEKLEELLIKSIIKRIKDTEVAILFSGGLDSALLAHIIQNLDIEVHLISACFKDSKDYQNSIKVAKIFKLPLVIEELTDEKIRKQLKTILHTLEDPDTLGVEIAIPLHFATRVAHEHGFKSTISGQGADELFAGYNRYERMVKKYNYQYLQNILYNDLINLWHHDLERDNKICTRNSIELKTPYLDLRLIKFCLTIPPKFKLKKIKEQFIRKHILKVLGKKLGLEQQILDIPKVAAQYGSGASKGLKRITNQLGLNNEIARSFGYSSAIEVLTNILYHNLGFPGVELKLKKVTKPIINQVEELF